MGRESQTRTCAPFFYAHISSFFLCNHIFLYKQKYLDNHKQPQKHAHSLSLSHTHKQTPDGIQNSIKQTASDTKNTFRICPLDKLWQLRSWWRPGVVHGTFGGISFVNSFLAWVQQRTKNDDAEHLSICKLVTQHPEAIDRHEMALRWHSGNKCEAFTDASVISDAEGEDDYNDTTHHTSYTYNDLMQIHKQIVLIKSRLMCLNSKTEIWMQK